MGVLLGGSDGGHKYEEVALMRDKMWKGCSKGEINVQGSAQMCMRGSD